MTKIWSGIFIALALAGCASRAVRETPAELKEFTSTYEVKQTWSADIGGSSSKNYLRLMPKVNQGTVYTASPEGRVRAFEVDSGKPKWDVELNVPASGAVGVGESLVLIGTRDAKVIALESATGKALWTAAVSSEVLAPPSAGGGIVAAQTIDGRVFGLAVADGKRLWVYERTEPALSLRGTDAPVVVADAVVAGFASGKLVALRLSDGGVLWEATVSQPKGRNEIERLVDVDSTPLIFPDAVYAANYQGKLAAINPRSGAILWARDVSTYNDIAADRANIYVTDDKGRVLAFDRRTGASLWKQEALRARQVSAPVVYGDFVAVADFEGYVHWLARDDGRFVARYQASGGAVRAPSAVGDDTLFVASVGGTLNALHLVQK